MKANVLVDWEHLEMKDVNIPTIGDDEVLVRVLYSGICGSDVTVYHHRHLTATVPRIMCHEILGEVEKINSSKKQAYEVGDRVVIHPLEECGICPACLDGNFHVCKNLKIFGLHREGGFAEYVVAQTKRLFKVSDDIPSKVAILTEPLAVGYHACCRALLSTEESVLVIGGGPIGIMTAVCAKYFRASRVVIAEVNKERLDFIKSLGFETIDSGENDIGDVALAMTDGYGFDKVFEASGSKPGELAIATATKIRGKAVLVGIPSVPREFQINKIVLKEIEILGCRVHELKDFASAYHILEKMHRNKEFDFSKMISAELPLEQLEEGIKLQESGKMFGKIIISVAEKE